MLIELKIQNPNMRIRSSEQLGPREKPASIQSTVFVSSELPGLSLPLWRLGLQCQLRILEAITEHTEGLTAALQFFVEVNTYHQMTGQAPAESEMTEKMFHGNTVIGVARHPMEQQQQQQTTIVLSCSSYD